jgi:soluble P-type ATPase
MKFVLALADAVRPEAKTFISRMHQLGIDCHMLTGDSQIVAGNICSQVGIPVSNCYYRLFPADKQALVKKWQKSQSETHSDGDDNDDRVKVDKDGNANANANAHTNADIQVVVVTPDSSSCCDASSNQISCNSNSQPSNISEPYGKAVLAGKINEKAHNSDSSSSLSQIELISQGKISDNRAHIHHPNNTNSTKQNVQPTNIVQLKNKSHDKQGYVMMIGDGINDSIALTEAFVGVAMGATGSSMSSGCSAVILLNENLLNVSGLIQLCRDTVDIIYENILFSVLMKILGLVLASVGYLLLWHALLIDVGSLIVVILNGCRPYWSTVFNHNYQINNTGLININASTKPPSTMPTTSTGSNSNIKLL